MFLGHTKYVRQCTILKSISICGTQTDRKVGLTIRQIHLKVSFIYKYKTSTLTPFVKPPVCT